MNLNGVRVTRLKDSIFVPLPRELWRSSGPGACICGHCYGTGYYDTLAVSAGGFSDRTWMVHYPELQPASVMEALREETLKKARRAKAACECGDPGCPVHEATVRRFDMEDGETRFRMCRACAQDALASGVFA